MKVTDYALGAGPYTATRIEHDAGSSSFGSPVEIRMFNGRLVGHGDTAPEAAKHLADQLRELARLVEGHEGIEPAPKPARKRKG